MSLISNKFADELCEKDMRDAYLDEQTYTKIVEQIRVLRAQRGLSQADSAKLLGKPQSNVSQRLENRDYRGFSVNTLLDVAHAYDVGIVVEFVPYADFIKRTNDLSKSALEVSSFDRQSLDPICKETSPQGTVFLGSSLNAPLSIALNAPLSIAGDAFISLVGQSDNSVFQNTTGISAYSSRVGTQSVANVGALANVSTMATDVVSYRTGWDDFSRAFRILRQGDHERHNEASVVGPDPQAIGIGVVG